MALKLRLGITLLSSKIIWGHKMQLKGGSDPSKRDSCLLDYELNFGSHCHRGHGDGKTNFRGLEEKSD